MTTENTRLAVHTIVQEYDELVIYEMITEQKHDYIDLDDIEEHGSVDDAYDEVGRGEAESDILNQVIDGCGIELSTDEYCEVNDTLCEIWMISTS